MMETVSVVGLGKLGSPMVACLAESGYQVIGVDLNEDFVRCVDRGRAPVVEPELDEMLQRNKNLISATTDYSRAIQNSDVTFLIVPTPSLLDGSFTNEYLLDSCTRIGNLLKEKSGYHLVVITSTVMPGSTVGEIIPCLEKTSEKKCGQDFGVCYSPEFIALGSVIQDFLNPDFVLLGECDTRAGEQLEKIYQKVCKNKPPIARMKLVNAELTKISVNTYVTMKMTFANTLARVCEQLPEADVDVVTNAVGTDSRIGRKYLKGSIGYGGPCFPRDNVAFARMASKLGIDSRLPEATEKTNVEQSSLIAKVVDRVLQDQGTSPVSILGVSYKPETPVVTESEGIRLALQLKKKYPVRIHDPLALENAKAAIGEGVDYVEDLQECIQDSKLIIVATPWSEYRRLPTANIQPGTTIIDCWRSLEHADWSLKGSQYSNSSDRGVNVISLGRYIEHPRKGRKGQEWTGTERKL